MREKDCLASLFEAFDYPTYASSGAFVKFWTANHSASSWVSGMSLKDERVRLTLSLIVEPNLG